MCAKQDSYKVKSQSEEKGSKFYKSIKWDSISEDEWTDQDGDFGCDCPLWIKQR